MATNSKLGEQVRETRERQGLSLRKLAKRARVAIATLIKLEEKGNARSDSIIRIAHALGRPPDEWLQLAGHEISAARVGDIVKQLQMETTTSSFRRMDPEKWFEHLEEELRIRKSGLMCVSITSRMSISTPALQKQTLKLLQDKLHFALVAPYPPIAPNMHARIPGLVNYYNRVFTWTLELAQQVQEWFPNAKQSVKVFTPVSPSEGFLLIPPPIRVNEIRPCFTKFSGTNEFKDPRYELGTYVRFGDGRPDQWVETYSGEGQMTENNEEAFNAWRDYFRPICDAWSPDGYRAKFDSAVLGPYWSEIPIV